MLRRDIAQQLLPAAADLGAVVVAHSPNGHGSCTMRGAHPTSRYPAAFVPHLKRSPELTPPPPGGSPWPGCITGSRYTAYWYPDPGTTRVSHLRSNVSAVDLVLSDDELRRLATLQAAS